MGDCKSTLVLGTCPLEHRAKQEERPHRNQDAGMMEDPLSTNLGRHRKLHRERQRQTDKDTETERLRDRGRHTETERYRDKETDKDRDTEA